MGKKRDKIIQISSTITDANEVVKWGLTESGDLYIYNASHSQWEFCAESPELFKK